MNTSRILRALRIGLLVVTLLAGGGVVIAKIRVQAATDTIRDRIARSSQLVVLAKEEFVKADNAAIDSFASGTALMSGPGVEYENAISTAGRRLAQLAELNAAGDVAMAQIQVTQGLLVTYLGLMAQADAHFRGGADATLAVAYLRYASGLLHKEILGQLDYLQDREELAYHDQVAVGPGSLLVQLLWLVPIVLLLAGAVWTQVFLARRFRRTFSVPLVAATVLVLVLAVFSASNLTAGGDLRSAGESRLAYVRASNQYVAELGRAQRASFAGLVRAQCSSCVDDSAVDSGATQTRQDMSARWVQFSERLAAIATGGGFTVNVVLVVIVFVLLLVGIHPRIEEYRYQSR